MLFDLRGRGRRRAIQAIYLSLALLMGGGLGALRHRRRRPGRPGRRGPGRRHAHRGHLQQADRRRREEGGRRSDRCRGVGGCRQAALPAGGDGRELQPEHRPVHRRRQGGAAQERGRLAALPEARPQEGRRLGRRLDGAGVHRAGGPRRGRSGHGVRDRRPRARRRSSTSSSPPTPTRRARPARATSRATRPRRSRRRRIGSRSRPRSSPRRRRASPPQRSRPGAAEADPAPSRSAVARFLGRLH